MSAIGAWSAYKRCRSTEIAFGRTAPLFPASPAWQSARRRQGTPRSVLHRHSGSLVLLDAQGERARRGQIGDHSSFGSPTPTCAATEAALVRTGGVEARRGHGRRVLAPSGRRDCGVIRCPMGIPSQPIEPIISGKLTRDGAGQWLLPGPDGSIHVLSADGKPLDKFNYGPCCKGWPPSRSAAARAGSRFAQRAGGVEGGIGGLW